MDATIIIAIVPVILLVAYIVWLVRAKITEGRDIDLREPITALVVCLVAVLIIGSMTASTVTYTYSSESQTLYINNNIVGSSQPWDSYSEDVRNLVIKDGVSIGSGTLDSLTALEHVSIGDGVTVASGAFGGHIKDQYGQPIAQPSSGEYYGDGTGDVYVFDPDIFTYNASQTVISGLADADAAYLVLPKERNGNTLIAVGGNAFKDQTGIVKLLSVPDSSMASFYTSAFEGCTSLTTVVLPDHMTGLGEKAFYGCTSLTSVEVPDTLNTMWASVFYNCTSLASIEIPDIFTTFGTGVFANCASITEFHFPATVTQIGAGCFSACTGVAEVSFEEGFAATLGSGCFGAWTFYASDATTTIDKTVAANLAGKTFQGTAAALVEVAPGSLSLSPEQIQIVHLHDVELQDLKDQISIDPLPFQPSLQTQEQEPVSA